MYANGATSQLRTVEIIPTSNNLFQLGNTSYRWSGVWATDTTINSTGFQVESGGRDIANEIMSLRETVGFLTLQVGMMRKKIKEMMVVQ